MNDITEHLDTVIVHLGLGYCTYLLSKKGYQIYRGKLSSQTAAGGAAEGASTELIESVVAHTDISAKVLLATPGEDLLNESALEIETPVHVMPRKRQAAAANRAPQDVKCDVPIPESSSNAQPSIGSFEAPIALGSEPSLDSIVLQESGITIQNKIESDGESIISLNAQCQTLCSKLKEIILSNLEKPAYSNSQSSTGQFSNQSTV